MGLLNKFIRVVKAKANNLLNNAEDPIEQLELAYDELEDKRDNVRSSIVDVIAQRKRLESRVSKLQDEVQEHNRQSRALVNEDEDDLARVELEKKKSKMKAIEKLQGQITQLDDLEQDMRDQHDEIESRLDELETEKEVLKARYEGAEAIEAVNESLSEGIGDFSIEDAVSDVREDVEQMEARAEAIQEFDDSQQSHEDRVEEIATDAEVESELESLRGEAEAEVA